MRLKRFLLSLLPTRTIIEYRDVIHPGPEFQSWTGTDGTYFKFEPLARVKDAREYLLAAYPAGFFENKWSAIYRRLQYSDKLIAQMGVEAFEADLEREMADFTAYYYSLPDEERLKVDSKRIEGSIPTEPHNAA